MSYRIEVTGENIQAVFQDVMNLAIVMGQGGNNAFHAPVAVPAAEPVEQPVQTAGVTAEPNPEVAPLPAEKRKPGRPPKVQVVEAVASPVDAVAEVDILMTGPEMIVADDVQEVKTFTLKEDVQPRLRAIDDAYKARNNKPGIDAKALQAASVNYMVQLLSKFGAKSTRDLKPDQFAGFMAESVAYLDGTAAEVA